MPTVEQVREALKDVKDPEIMMGILDLGLVYDVDIEGPDHDEVTVTMTLTSPMCPVGPIFKQQVQAAVEKVEGVKSARVDITFSPPWDPREMASEEAKLQLGIW
jgi:metal-sulfur cluster biosynthetic enzyme